jgi:hypothetical protein
VKDKSLRDETIRDFENGIWFDRWMDSAHNYWFSHWDQDSPWKDTYIGHPLMGAISQGIWVQNDPYGMTMQWDNSPEYWKSRLRALPLTIATSFEWKLGPISEASLGNSGCSCHGPGPRGTYYEPLYHKWGNDTGLGPIVTTPVGGFLWFWGEDYLDVHLMPKLESKSHNPMYLIFINVATPAHGFANLLRFKAPWYRPYRRVKARW